jgi:hypothetical protein
MGLRRRVAGLECRLDLIAGSGVIVPGPHRCEPPGSYEWCGYRKVYDDKRGPAPGTVWRCDCGLAWEVGNDQTSLWYSWDRASEHDRDRP